MVLGYRGPLGGFSMNDQVVELTNPGLLILLCSPRALGELEDGCDYARRFPDGKDLVDYINECRAGAIGVRWPGRDYWLHFSSTIDPAVIARASDHIRLGLTVQGGCLCVRRGDDLFAWRAACPDDQLVTVADGVYDVTACLLPHEGAGPVRIFLYLAPARARPDLGYADVPFLHDSLG
jgi:hypothetical protein